MSATGSPPSEPGRHWVAVWACALQGTYPVGSAIAQPDLSRAIVDPALGVQDQCLRMVLRPARLAARLRVRLCNPFGDRPIRVQDAGLAMHLGAGALLPGSWRALRFSGQDHCAIPPGKSLWSDPVDLISEDPSPLAVGAGSELAVSWHVIGPSGPLSWHAKAMATSYLSDPGGSARSDGPARDFPHSSTSWYLIDAVDAWLPVSSFALVTFGDSLTDGTNTTLNGHDRWPDVLRARLLAMGATDICVINTGIGGNQVRGPAVFDPRLPWRGGPSALDRLAVDVLDRSGVRGVIWLEGINDFSGNGNASGAEVLAAMQAGIARLRQSGLKVWCATVPSAFQGRRDGHGGPAQERERQHFNAALRAGALGVPIIDLDRALTDLGSGRLAAQFDTDSTFGGEGDGLHPNRLGHLAMAEAIELEPLLAALRTAGL